LKVKPVGAGVTFFDDNGPKGGVAMRCALTARVPYRPTLRVEKTAQTRRAAFDEAVKALDRQLDRYRERDRDSRRHPKKYFVAKRLIASVSAKPPSTTGK
jgi:ribosome-associated translation inhibitor RaiA